MRNALILILLLGCRSGFELDGDAGPSISDATVDAFVPGCGNGVLEPDDESCDDGNRSDLDGCLNDCTIARCGDGIVRTTIELCDDGNDISTDGCTSECVTAPGTDRIVCTDDGRCFGLYAEAIPWVSLESACNQRGGRRAVFNSAAENDLVATELGLTVPAWIGLTYVTVNWSWGLPEGGTEFLRFGPGFPTEESEGRSALLRTDGTWQDDAQVSTHPHICLFEPRWRIEPTTGHAYGQLSELDSFAGARLLCQDLGFDLASVTSAEENLLVTAAANGERSWLGLNLDRNSSSQEWVDGEPLGYTNWADDHPRESVDCLELERNGTWNTESCGGMKPALCEAK